MTNANYISKKILEADAAVAANDYDLAHHVLDEALLYLLNKECRSDE